MVDGITGRLDFVLRTGAQIVTLTPPSANYKRCRGDGFSGDHRRFVFLAWSAAPNAPC
jgi:hypothetical protein